MQNNQATVTKDQFSNTENDTQQATLKAPVAERAAPKSKRKKLFGILGVAVLFAAAIFGVYWFAVLSKQVSTDNAYVAAEIAQVAPSINGTVQDVLVNDTQAVKKGDELVRIDPTDAKLALAQAQAELGQAERRVRGYFATDEGMAAQVTARQADQQRAKAESAVADANFKTAQLDLDRRKALSKSGSVSGEELSNAQNAFAGAEAALATAKAAEAQAEANYNAAIGMLKANTVLTANTTEETNPEVALARARLDQAKVDLDRTIIRAPVDGIVAKRQVQLGQRVTAGTVLMSVVPLLDVHIDANFKEVQLEHVKIGQDATVTSDLYGDGVVFHGKVTGFSGGTGAAFALIPSQNATGNWIKVVQRLPVRITLDPEELKIHPLQVGLSTDVEIDITTGGTRPMAQE